MTNAIPARCRRGSACRCEKSMAWDLQLGNCQTSKVSKKCPPACGQRACGRKKSHSRNCLELVLARHVEGATVRAGVTRVISQLMRTRVAQRQGWGNVADVGHPQG